jgi:hypothetical protein
LSTSELPFVDEHAIDVAAPCARAWEALLLVVSSSFRGRATELVAGLLGASETGPRGRPGEPGSAIAGFTVAAAEAPTLLALEGAHRFSRYALVFHLEPLGGERCRVRAETRAEFGGLHGRIYRAAVIGTRGHVLVVRRMLRAIRARSES